MATYVKYNIFVEDVAEKIHNLGSDTLKVALTNAAPNTSTHTVLSDITDLTTSGGYTAGGTQATQVTSAQSGGIYKLVLNDVVFTASGGSIGPFQYAVLYNSTPTTNSQGTSGKPLIAYWNYGSSITVLSGETFTWDADGTTGVLTIT